MPTTKPNWIKFSLALLIAFLVRIIPLRPPNVEPILATQMPFSKTYGSFVGFTFAFLSMTLFDLVMGRFGIWTLITALTYGVLGIFAALYFQKKEATAPNFAKFAVFGTLFFDAVTGLTVGPLFFNQTFYGALVGQVPFTLWHLAGNVGFAVTLSPAIHHYIIQNEKLEVNLELAYEK